MKQQRVFSPNLDSELITGSKKYIPIMILIGAMVVPAIFLIGLLWDSTLALFRTEEGLISAGAALTFPIMAYAAVIAMALLELRYSRKFKKVSKAMRTAVVMEDDKLTVMECAKRQKGRYETFNGSVMFNPNNGITNEDMLAIYNIRTGIEQNNKSLSIAQAQVQDQEYILKRYSNRGEDFKYTEYRNLKLVGSDDKLLVFQGEETTLQGPKVKQFTILNIFPELDKAVG